MNDVRTVFQEPNGLYPIGEHKLTESELDSLILLMPDTRWIIVRWAFPQDFNDVVVSHESIVNYSALNDSTLHKIADGQPLQQSGFEDIVNSIE